MQVLWQNTYNRNVKWIRSHQSYNFHVITIPTLTQLGYYNTWNTLWPPVYQTGFWIKQIAIFNNTSISLNSWLMRSRNKQLSPQQSMYCQFNTKHCNCICRLQWHHVLGSSRSGIPWDKPLVSSWPRIPQDSFETHGQMSWHPHLQPH